MESFVVGLDDSEDAARAFRWALQESRRHDAHLVVVHAWEWPYTGTIGELANDLLERLDFADASQQVLAAMVDAARAPDSPDVDLELRVVEAQPAEALLNAAAADDADLLIVGSRGRGGVEGLLLGSVSQQVAQDASCPVVIVPPGERDRG